MKRIFLFLSCSCIVLGDPIQWTIASGGNGHYYDVVSAPNGITWSAASAAATAMGGYLATITSDAENNFVFSLAEDPAYDVIAPTNPLRAIGPWLGAYRTGSGPSDFAWVTGELFSYTNWASGEPSNSGGDENNIDYIGKCSSTPCSIAPTWNDYSSTTPFYGGQLPVGYVVEFNTDPVPEPGSMAVVVAAVSAMWLRRRLSRRILFAGADLPISDSQAAQRPAGGEIGGGAGVLNP